MTDAKTPLLSGRKPPVSRPKNRRRRSSFEASTYNSTAAINYVREPTTQERSGPGLTLVQLLALTVCMAGVQFTWTVELSYGTPYLLSLNLSKELTALVWLAGPLSGLIVQPVIGAFSDKCQSRFGKRRPFIVGAGILTCLAMIGVAYAKEIGAIMALWLPNASNDDWSHFYAVVVAVSSFYFLDFTLNAVQAICRALILDIPPLWQQEQANAWSARMSNLSMVIGYFVGYIDLVRFFPWLGDSQIKVFCIVAMLVFCVTLAITCVCVHETPLETADQDNGPWYHTFIYIWRAFRFMPRPIQTLCNTQFFAWMGWFPFLFYSTQWVSDIYFATHPVKDRSRRDWAEGTRAGSFALLCYSIVSVVAGVVIPDLSMKLEQRYTWLSLNNIYTLSHVVSAVALLSAWVIRSVVGATIMLSVMGISWAIVLWIPFSLVGEYVSYEDERRTATAAITNGQQSSSGSVSQLENNMDDFDAGMILGVHNMYIVFPQFAVAIISSIIFALNDAVRNDDGPEDSQVSSVAPVLVFGGFMALIAAVFSRYVVRVKH
ncbi:major facilitator superfamily domain-containing protein [Gongronella butleri]|nr:major facilitator superfamily domain-containing protein [Gongronella butleri]